MVHFEVATDPRYIFKWPELVHFEWPPRINEQLRFFRTLANCRTLTGVSGITPNAFFSAIEVGLLLPYYHAH